ncbi:MAG: tellurium resistance protein [Rhodobacter sp.]|nr:tellurium resistance protein [Rhodobacter sp.]
MTPQQPPAFRAQTHIPFWRRTPPAVFPPLMGLFGLALAWGRAVEPFSVPRAISDLLLGAVALVFLFALGAYGAKLVKRPGVVVEDLRILPGRTGLAAMSLCALLLAVGLVPIMPIAAQALLFAGLAVHLGLAALMIHSLMTSPPEARQVTPAWHLSFVGFVVAPLSAAPLGFDLLAQALLAGTMAIAALIYGASAAQVLRRGTPPSLRPLLAIHLAPVCLFGTTAMLLDLTGLAVAFAGLASAGFVALVLSARYLTAAGFSALWGAFTFPLAAFSGLMLDLGGQGATFRIVGGVTLVAATLLIPWIAAKVLQLWIKGALAVKTNAAVA